MTRLPTMPASAADATPPTSCACPPQAAPRSSRSRSPSPTPRPRSSKVPVSGPPERSRARRPDDDPPERRVDERSRPRLIRADLALQLDGGLRCGSSRPSSRRNGRVSVAPSSDCGRGGKLAAEPRLQASIEQTRPPSSSSAASSARRRLACRRAATRSCATIGPVSSPASMRMSVTPVSASPARIAAGIGVAPRWRGSSEGWRFSAPCSSSEQLRPGRSGRSRRGRAARDRARGPRRWTPGRAGASGVRIALDAELLGEPRGCRVARPAVARRPWRSGDDADQVDVVATVQTPEALPPEAATPQEDGPRALGPSEDRGRSVEAIGPRIHARALVASRTSASSSLLAPTGISSSIESR